MVVIKKRNAVRCLVASIIVTFFMGCSEPQPELPPEERWAREGVDWSSSQLQQLENGAKTYRVTCAGCHLSQGQGQTLIGAPALNRNPLVTADETREITQIVLSGRNAMPTFATTLNDEQLADLLSYIRNAWDNRSNNTISSQSVSDVRKSLSTN